MARASFIVFLFLMTSCSPALQKRDLYLQDFDQGALASAEEQVSKTLEREVPGNQFRGTTNASWLWLDRGTMRLAFGNPQLAATDYNLALEAIDYYRQDELSEDIGKLLLRDGIGAYAGSDFEQVLARLYFALALLQDGDKNNARAILRQAEEFQQKLTEEYNHSILYPGYTPTPIALSKLLFGELLAQEGDTSNARILFQEAASIVPNTQLAEQLSNAADQLPDGDATILVLCHNGRAPRKISVTTDASVASTIALDFFLNRDHEISLTSLAGISTPALCSSLHPPLLVNARIDHTQQTLMTSDDIGQMAHYELDHKLPVIVARGVARYLLRKEMVAITKEHDECAGDFLDLFMFFANLATEADTRSWATLPERLDIARFPVNSGTHTIHFTTPLSENSLTINVSKGDVAVIHLFIIQPGCLIIQAPKYKESIL